MGLSDFIIKRVRLKRFLPVLTILLVLLIFKLPHINLPLDRDEGGYSYIGWLWLSGKGIPYLSVFDQKPPLSFLFVGIASLIGGNSFYSIRVFALLYMILFTLIYYYFVLRLTNRQTAFLSSLVVVFYLSSVRLQGTDFNLELQTLLPLLIFVFLIWDLYYSKRFKYISAFFAGFAASIAILLKQNAIFTIAGISIWFFADRIFQMKKFKRKDWAVLFYESFLIFFGAFLPILIFVIYFWQNKAIPWVYKDIFIYNRYYSSAALRPESIAGVGGSRGLVGYLNWLKMVPSTLILFFWVTILGLINIWKSKNKLWWLSTLLVFTLWLGVKAGGSREFPHYYLSLVFGLGIGYACLSFYLYKKKHQLLIYILTILLICWVFVPEARFLFMKSNDLQKVQYGGEGVWSVEAVDLGKWIRENVPENETLIVWANEPEIYYYAHKKLYLNYMHFYGFYYFPDDEVLWLKKLDEAPPDWIVAYTGDPATYSELEKFLGITGIGNYSQTSKPFSYSLIKQYPSYYVLRKNK